MAPIQTGPDRHFVTSSYLVGLLYRWSMRRHTTAVDVGCESFDVPPFAEDSAERATLVHEAAPRHSTAPVCDATATADGRGTTVFLVNRDLSDEMRVEVSGLPARAAGRFRHLTASGPFTRNSLNRPNGIGFGDIEVVTGETGSCEIVVPPHGVGALSVDRA